MDKDTYAKYKQAGKIAADARDFGASLLKPGVSYLHLAQQIEERIIQKGAGIAFPVNIARNEIAAHYSPRKDDTLTIQSGDVVKVDVGAHVDGYIADTAVTVEVGTHTYDTLIQASAQALEKAIQLTCDGVSPSTMGKAIQSTITSYGYKPINNLTGHSMKQYELHSGLSIPNIGTTSSMGKPKTGDVLAIEPFATNGAGHVVAGKGSNIYLCNPSIRSRLVRDNRAKMMFQKLYHTFKTLPFAQRWCHDLFPKEDLILQKLSYLGFIKHYPQLIDAKQGIVTQKEHTVIVKDNGCEVIT